MRHRVSGRRLGRTTNHRKMLKRNLVTELFRHEKIKTTLPKAKFIRSRAEKLIT
ncbi:MAG: 50S ribosomal protein L17, partial [Chloroflexi bacterium]|nr:50S ribosomal protein L17 [Chloroflexota bacterium]